MPDVPVTVASVRVGSARLPVPAAAGTARSVPRSPSSNRIVPCSAARPGRVRVLLRMAIDRSRSVNVSGRPLTSAAPPAIRLFESRAGRDRSGNNRSRNNRSRNNRSRNDRSRNDGGGHNRRGDGLAECQHRGHEDCIHRKPLRSKWKTRSSAELGVGKWLPRLAQKN